MQVNRIDQTGNVMADEKWRFQEYEHALTGGKILESNFVNFERTLSPWAKLGRIPLPRSSGQAGS